MDLDELIDKKLGEVAETLCYRDVNSLHEWEIRMLMEIQQRLQWKRHAEELKNCSCIPIAKTDVEPKPKD